MTQDLEKTIALISRTPAMLDALLRDLPEEWSLQNEGGDTWSAREIVGHLIYGDAHDWVPRAKRILEFGESKPFDPFDRLGQRRFMEGKPLNQLLDEFKTARGESLRQLRALNLQPADMEKRGMHPRLGVVTLSQLLATWAGHDLSHLHQVSRVMAYQYRDAVGPWTAFLGVMQCEGHSS